MGPWWLFPALDPLGPKLGTELKIEFLGPGVRKTLETEFKTGQGKTNSTLFRVFRLVFKSVSNFFGPRARKAPGTHVQLHSQLRAGVRNPEIRKKRVSGSKNACSPVPQKKRAL